MTIKESYEKFRNYFNFVHPQTLDDIADLDTSFIDPILHGKSNQFKRDVFNRAIRVGDVVSFDRIGGVVKGISVGVVLGYTDTGYRVAQIGRNVEKTFYWCNDIKTPYHGHVVLIKSNSGNM